MNRPSPAEPPAYGVLGIYTVEGDPLYGLFVKLLGAPVFVDLAEDELLERRKATATQLFENSQSLERAFREFSGASSELRQRGVGQLRIDEIWLHDRADPELIEVRMTADQVDDGWRCLLRQGVFSDLTYSPG
jgi:hypothetical protein